MKLSRLQRNTLLLYQHLQQASPTVGRLLVANRWNYLRSCLIYGLGIAYTFSADMPSLGWLLVGLAVGSFLRDIDLYRRTVRVWPALSEVLDWARLDALLNTPDPNQADAVE